MLDAHKTESARKSGSPDTVNVGLLAFQGAYEAHRRVISRLGTNHIEVKTHDDLRSCTHLILPGGESTTFLKLLEYHDLTGALRDHADSKKPILATCAGLILLASTVKPFQDSLGILDITIERNAYGRQVDSFEADLTIPTLGDAPFHGVFIRAPKISGIGPDLTSLAAFEDSHVFIREGNIFGCTFHPELSSDTRIHKLFLESGT